MELSLPASISASSNRYRSANDNSLDEHIKFLLHDTPGHGKLRQAAGVTQISAIPNLRGIIYMLDAAAMSEADGLRDAAEYLHDVLLTLQRRSIAGRKVDEIPVLIAANKMDLFTAVPAATLKKALEKEITSIKASRAKGLMDVEEGEEKEELGGGEGPFEFAQMEDVEITVHGGSASSPEGPDVNSWWGWIGRYL